MFVMIIINSNRMYSYKMFYRFIRKLKGKFFLGISINGEKEFLLKEICI